MEPKPKKSLGQNFLADEQVAKDLTEAAEIKKSDTVLEVGAGTGVLTKFLAQKAKKVIAVEIDPDLIHHLKKNLENLSNVEIVNTDILTLDISEFSPSKIVGSIPYQITSPLIHKILHSQDRPKSITFVVQKEVAEKICAKSPKATYLSVFVENFGKAQIIRTIKPSAFTPPPKVDSAILHIDLFAKPKIEDTYKVEKLLHHGFRQQRKMIKHRFPAEVLKDSQIPPHQRPANLTKEDWHRIYRTIGATREKRKTRRGGGVWIDIFG
ncbi:MAG TPA: ribosomal RNA small subunit methyltransferase A [candidate division WWE3 bacterium]|uniref:Ribosomal RNA small subunit methyltransferase A n=1 Tax=candidate division WWE3 bacterium TaxID=2053526 RepID=A0A7C1NY49_UNCKA|nr:ribosomal RNA small subunit methyltransferase A [candidate division WWE3 bacterium]